MRTWTCVFYGGTKDGEKISWEAEFPPYTLVFPLPPEPMSFVLPPPGTEVSPHDEPFKTEYYRAVRWDQTYAAVHYQYEGTR